MPPKIFDRKQYENVFFRRRKTLRRLHNNKQTAQKERWMKFLDAAIPVINYTFGLIQASCASVQHDSSIVDVERDREKKGAHVRYLCVRLDLTMLFMLSTWLIPRSDRTHSIEAALITSVSVIRIKKTLRCVFTRCWRILSPPCTVQSNSIGWRWSKSCRRGWRRRNHVASVSLLLCTQNGYRKLFLQ